MNGRVVAPMAVFLAGVACIVAAAAKGEAEVQLFIIFPLISGTSWLFILGVVLVIASFILGFVLVASAIPEEGEGPRSAQTIGSSSDAAEAPARRQSRYGGVVLIGPVPIVFGSDRNITLIMLAVAIAIVAVVLAIALLKP